MTTNTISYDVQPSPESRVLAMRASVDGGEGLDRLTTFEIRVLQEQLRARAADPTRAERERRNAEAELWRSMRALRPDYSDRVHLLDCQYVERYQEGCFTTPGENPRQFVFVELSALPEHAIRCYYCFDGGWGPGEPYLPDASPEEIVAWRGRGPQREARRKRSRRHMSVVGRIEPEPTLVRPGAVRLGDTVEVVDATGDAQQLTIVAPGESRPNERRFSTESPVGRSLLGAVAGETVTVPTPHGVRRLAVRSVTSPSSDSAKE